MVQCCSDISNHACRNQCLFICRKSQRHCTDRRLQHLIINPALHHHHTPLALYAWSVGVVNGTRGHKPLRTSSAPQQNHNRTVKKRVLFLHCCLMPFYFYLAGLQIHFVSLLDCKVPLEIPSRIAQGAFFCMPYG